MPTRPSEETVGKLFVSPAGRIYKQVSYCGVPTAAFEEIIELDPSRDGGYGDLSKPERVEAAIGSPLLANLRLLVPEED